MAKIPGKGVVLQGEFTPSTYTTVAQRVTIDGLSCEVGTQEVTDLDSAIWGLKASRRTYSVASSSAEDSLFMFPLFPPGSTGARTPPGRFSRIKNPRSSNTAGASNRI